MKLMDGIIKEPGKPAHREMIRNDLATLQSIVGGYIETFTIADDAAIICNEEGRLKGMAYDFNWGRVSFVGPVIFAGVDEDEFTSLSSTGIKEIERVLEVRK